MVATVLWMLGEAMADVTTETLVPELLPRSQYEVSSAIRALQFLVGGLAGYIALVVFRDAPYVWLYYAYLIVMFLCAFLTLCSIQAGDIEAISQRQRPRPSPRGELHHQQSTGFWSLVVRAYYVPANYRGGFPRACLSIFVFSLGSAPMFFLLLMVRDIIGVDGQRAVQTHFGCISMLFFIMAAISSILGAATSTKATTANDGDGVLGERPPPHEAAPAAGGDAGSIGAEAEGDGDSPSRAVEDRATVASRWRLMVLSTVSFGVVCAVIPTVGLMSTMKQRLVAFYFVGAALGFSFGAVYQRFQECTWSLIPPHAEIANAMGFCGMCKLAGVGIGNFLVGIILDRSSGTVGGHGHGTKYSLSGYWAMCAFCTVAVLSAAALCQTIPRIILTNRKETHVA